MSKHKVPLALVEDAEQIPQVCGISLYRRGRAKKDVIGPSGDLAHESQQLVRGSCILAKALACSRLVGLVEYDDTKAQPKEMLLLQRITHHQSGGHDADAQRTPSDMLAT